VIAVEPFVEMRTILERNAPTAAALSGWRRRSTPGLAEKSPEDGRRPVRGLPSPGGPKSGTGEWWIIQLTARVFRCSPSFGRHSGTLAQARV
jgi:hypothetical protein